MKSPARAAAVGLSLFLLAGFASPAHAAKYKIHFGDTKEGSFAVRVADEIRLNGKGHDGVVSSSSGQSVKAPAKENLPMWGEIADWHDYSGTKNGKVVGVTLFTNNEINRSPVAWHTRAYGLMSANPFAREKSEFPSMKNKTWRGST